MVKAQRISDYISALKSLGGALANLSFEERQEAVLKSILDLNENFGGEITTVYFLKDSLSEFKKRVSKIIGSIDEYKINYLVRNFIIPAEKQDGYSNFIDYAFTVRNCDLIVLELEREQAEPIMNGTAKNLCNKYKIPVITIF